MKFKKLIRDIVLELLQIAALIGLHFCSRWMTVQRAKTL